MALPGDAAGAGRGLMLDRVVLLGRTLEEYRRYFALDEKLWRAAEILDVAAGVSSFCAEANAQGGRVTAFDRIYRLPPQEIAARCAPDLDEVVKGMAEAGTYRWDFYKSPEHMREFRERAYRTFLADYTAHLDRYVPGELPRLPFADGRFALSLVSYLLLVYEDQFDYAFHQQSILELMRVTREEARLWPTVTFAARRCAYLDRFSEDPALAHLEFREVPTDFEFLHGSNRYLSIRHRPGTTVARPPRQ
jgi:hypothetical protein